LLGISRDISERKRLEKALVKSEEKFRPKELVILWIKGGKDSRIPVTGKASGFSAACCWEH